MDVGKTMKIKNRLELAKYFAERGLNTGAEIGVSDGRYSEVLCRSNPKLKLMCIDVWNNERIFALAKKKLAVYNTELIRQSSVEAAKDVADDSLDFVFIDADHNYKSVRNDILAWVPKVKSGGIVSGHDYYVFPYSRNRGVIDAVDEYVSKHNIKLHLTEWDYNAQSRDDRQPSWFFIKG